MMFESRTVTVHRCRFVDHIPSAITALAFPPSPLPSVKGKKQSEASKSHVKFGTLAVGRANGNIDLLEWTGNEKELQSAQAWVVRKTLSGLYPSKADSLAFIIRHPDELGPDDIPTWSDLRLFSSGGGSELIEWDLERGCIRRTINSQGGAIWCIAANPASNILAIGCEDGTVRLLSVINDTLTLSRRFDRLKSRVLSIAWGPPTPKRNRAKNPTASAEELSEEDEDEDDDDDDWTDSWLVTGGSDSSLRKWDVTTGMEIDRMAMEKIRGERTLVWSVGILGDGTIISGDSLGMVKFWDSWTCTQLATFKAHGADVLCIAIDPEGKAVYTSGVDQKVAQFTLAKTTSTDKSSFGFQGTSSRWVQTSSRRLHSHDVRTLAIWPVYMPLPSPYRKHHPIDVAPILASGGLDMLVTLTPIALPSSTIVKIVNPLVTSNDATFENSYHSRLPYNSGPSGTSSISVARDAKLIVCMREAGLSIWRLVSESITTEDDPLPFMQDPESRDWEKVLEMDLSVNGNLVSSAISNDGQWLVASDSFETKLFRLVTDIKGSLRPKRIRDLSAILEPHLKLSAPTPSIGAISFQFSPDSSRLIMTTAASSYVLVLDLTGDSPRVLRRFDHHRLRDTVIHSRAVKGRRKSKDEVTNVEMLVDEEASGEENDEAEAFNLPIAVVNILRIAVSPDGQWLATSDDHMHTHVFNLDSLQHHCVLPSFPKPAQAITFDPAHPNVLVMAFPNNTVQFYNVETRQFPAWSKDSSSALPRKVINAHDPVTGVVFYPMTQTSEGHNRYILLWGSTWICRLSLAEDKASAKSSKKRRRESMKELTAAYDHEEQSADHKMITHYRPILFLDFLSNGELVIIERPLIDILSTLPPPYFKPKYGAS